MKLKETLRQQALRNKTNWKSLVTFEIWYKILTSLMAAPLLVMLFQLSLKAAGIAYLGNDTLRRYLTTPLVYVIIGVMLLITTFVTLVEIFGAITGIHEAHANRRLTPSQLMRAGIDRAKQVVASRNLGIAVFVIFLLPFTNLLPLVGLISTIHIPGFIMDFIWANRLLAPLFSLVSLLLVWLVLQRIFMLHAYVLRQENAKDAFATSKRLMKGRTLSTLLRLIGCGILIGLLLAAVNALLGGIALVIIRLTVAPERRFLTALLTVSGIVAVVSLLTTLVSSLIGFIIVGELYYEYCAADNLPAEKRRERYPSFGKKSRIALLSVTGLLVLSSVLTTLLDPGYLDSVDRMNVVIAAHRGVSANAPENSIPAFQAAMDVNAQWIELDVHQTSDQVVVVTHDGDINRIAGVNKYVYDLTLEELRQYDVGSWFSPEYSYLRVATLDDVLKLCKGKINIQIELKPTGHEPDFEEHVAQIVRDNDFTNNCVLASMNADCLRRIKEVAPDMQTLYIMAAAIGDLSAADFADGFSIEESNISYQLVQEIHAMNKLCYVWTINSDENVRFLLDAGIDGILTDDPVMMQEAVMRGGMNKRLVYFLYDLFGME